MEKEQDPTRTPKEINSVDLTCQIPFAEHVQNNLGRINGESDPSEQFNNNKVFLNATQLDWNCKETVQPMHI